MSVNPGFGGQKFIANTLMKTEQLRNIIARKKIRKQNRTNWRWCWFGKCFFPIKSRSRCLVAGNTVFCIFQSCGDDCPLKSNLNFPFYWIRHIPWDSQISALNVQSCVIDARSITRSLSSPKKTAILVPSGCFPKPSEASRGNSQGRLSTDITVMLCFPNVPLLFCHWIIAVKFIFNRCGFCRTRNTTI